MRPFVSLLTRRELLWQFLVRNIKARHRGSILGAFWLVANPLLMLGLYVFAFGVVFGGRFTDSADESTIDYALGVFLGLNVLGLISGIIGGSPGIIVGQPNFVKKVVFPLEILPAATMGALAYDLLISFGLCLIGVLSVGPGLTISCFYAPIILFPVFLIALGLAWFFSALGVFIRDVGQIGSFLGLALLYSSGVFYSAAKAEATAPGIWQFLQWNPLLQIVDSLRQVILWGGEPNWWGVGYSWIFGVIVLLFGAWFFDRLRPAFADVL
ncbi:MAG: sugar ABC transporter permease [Opitutae bacterium]|nr:sugar ABC transporter permease [Opitutae bacterium]